MARCLIKSTENFIFRCSVSAYITVSFKDVSFVSGFTIPLCPPPSRHTHTTPSRLHTPEGGSVHSQQGGAPYTAGTCLRCSASHIYIIPGLNIRGLIWFLSISPATNTEIMDLKIDYGLSVPYVLQFII
jgi:hypothetical protein